MRRVLIISLAVLICTGAYSQKEKLQKPQLSKQEYQLKSRNQKKAAWICLAAGQVILWTGIAIDKGAYRGVAWDANIVGLPVNRHSVYENDKIKSTLQTIGFFGCMSSIPLFLASLKNKKRGDRLVINFKFQETLVPDYSVLTKKYIPSLQLRLGL